LQKSGTKKGLKATMFSTSEELKFLEMIEEADRDGDGEIGE
jgi:hypothetical protein